MRVPWSEDRQAPGRGPIRAGLYVQRMTHGARAKLSPSVTAADPAWRRPAGRPPGMPGAPPSPPGQCHRAGRTGACRFPIIGSWLCSLSWLSWPGAAWRPPRRSPGPGRIQDHAEGLEVPARFSAYLPAGTGLIGRVIGVPFRLRPAGQGIAAASAAQVTAESQRCAAGGAVAGHGGHRGGTGQGHVPVRRRDRVGSPGPGVTLLAPGAGQPADGVDAPAGSDRTGAGVGFAERCRIGMPGAARAHLAPHDRHPQLITDHGPHRSPGRPGGCGPGSGPGRDSGGSGPGGGSGRGGGGRGNGPGRGSWPGTAGRWPGAAMAGRHGVARLGRHGADMAGRLGAAGAGWHVMAIAGRHGVARATGARVSGLGLARVGGLGTFAVPELGEPVVHLEQAGVLCPDLGRHLEPPVEPVVSRAAAGDLPWGRTRRVGRSASCRPGSGGKRGGLRSCRPAALALTPLKAPGLTVSGFGLLTVPAWESQPDKHAVNVGPIYKLSRRGVWTIPVSSACTGRGSCSPS